VWPEVIDSLTFIPKMYNGASEMMTLEDHLFPCEHQYLKHVLDIKTRIGYKNIGNP
jgi:hypothetical protein